MTYSISALLINWMIFFFFLKNDKFYPAKAKLYWTLIIIFIPFGWIIYLVWGRNKYLLKKGSFHYKKNISLDENE